MKITGIPCCYYTTTVMLLDDDEKYLNILQDSVPSPHKIFTKVADALAFLAEAPLTAFHSNAADSDTHLASLKAQLERPERSEEISVLIVDYQMPGMNGLDFCKKVRSPHFKIIMLTGEATLALAVNAFNEGTIDRFIQKSTPHLHRELEHTIAEMQFKHFQDASAFWINSLSKQGTPLPWFLQNDVFCDFFTQIMQRHQISEYAVLNAEGDFMIRHADGRQAYLTVRDAAHLDALIKLEAEPAYWDEPSPEAKAIYESIQKKEQIPFLHTQEKYLDLVEWPLFPLQTETVGGQVFYYALTNVA